MSQSLVFTQSYRLRDAIQARVDAAKGMHWNWTSAERRALGNPGPRLWSIDSDCTRLRAATDHPSSGSQYLLLAIKLSRVSTGAWNASSHADHAIRNSPAWPWRRRCLRVEPVGQRLFAIRAPTTLHAIATWRSGLFA